MAPCGEHTTFAPPGEFGGWKQPFASVTLVVAVDAHVVEVPPAPHPLNSCVMATVYGGGRGRVGARDGVAVTAVGADVSSQPNPPARSHGFQGRTLPCSVPSERKI